MSRARSGASRSASSANLVSAAPTAGGIAVARQDTTVLSRPRLTVANMTALNELPLTLTDLPRLSVPLLRPSEAAELLSVRPSWIYEAVRANRLPCLRVGRHIRFTLEMLEAWLAEQGGQAQ
jgi:excisionase family DNA binding protein